MKVSKVKFQTLRVKKPSSTRYKNYLATLLKNDISFIFWQSTQKFLFNLLIFLFLTFCETIVNTFSGLDEDIFEMKLIFF